MFNMNLIYVQSLVKVQYASVKDFLTLFRRSELRVENVARIGDLELNWHVTSFGMADACLWGLLYLLKI